MKTLKFSVAFAIMKTKSDVCFRSADLTININENYSPCQIFLFLRLRVWESYKIVSSNLT